MASALPTADAPAEALIDALAEVERFYAARGAPCFLQLPEEAAEVRAAASARGYRQEAPSRILSFDARQLAARALATEARPYLIDVAAPLASLEELWDAGGIGPERRAVMARAAEASVWIARLDQRVAAAVFVAAAEAFDGRWAFAHALHVAPWARRRGAGADLITACARWALEHATSRLAVAVEATNAPAQRMFDGLGAAPVADYMYLRK